MNRKFRSLMILFFGLGLGVDALANGRTARLFPFDTPSGWSDSAALSAPCWLGFHRKIDFVNLSAIEQTVTVSMKNVKLGFTSCDGATPTPPYSGWAQVPHSPTCWGIYNLTSADQSTTLTVAPNGTGSVSFSVMCRMLRNVSPSLNCLTGAQEASGMGPSTYNSDLKAANMHQGESMIEVKVAENKGALLANVTGSPMSYCVDLRNPTRYNIPLNGGRPF